MGVSEGAGEGAGEGAEIDCSAGTIVWVRRRNGSWWPGRILGAEELSASHLMSPRSGTPVKLLGREDASVDWYNLEKSKRVKAFRCGEFDDCIERAEAAHGNLLKKREKYARREDAILHALELEKQQFQKIPGSLVFNSNHMGVNNGLSDNHYEYNKNADVFNSESLMALPVSKKLSSFDEEDVAEPLFSGEEKLMIEHGIEDGKSEMVQRMRGLQDFGLRTDSTKKKLPAPATLTDAGNFKVPPHNDNDKNPLAAKKKRSHNGPIDETYFKKRDRRRPLVQVLQSSAKLPSFDPSTSHDEAVSMSMCGETVGPVFRAKRSKCVYFPADDYLNKVEYPLHEMQVADHPGNSSVFRSSRAEDTDFLRKDCYGQNMEIPTTVQSGSRMLSIREPSHSGNSTPKDHTLETEELDGSMSSHSSHFHLNERTAAISANMGGSKWQLKGKRNIRIPSKRPSEIPDANHFYATEKFTDQGAGYESKENIVKKRSSKRALGRVLHGRKDDLIYDYYNDNDEEDDDDECDQVNGDDGSRGKDLMDASMVEFVSKRYPLTSKIHHVQELRSDGESTDLDDESVPGVRGYWEESGEYFNPYCGNSYNMALVDVDLKVQVSYKREQVPLVSLMSRLNGKAIVGHPLQVEKLEEGFSQHLFPQYDIGDGPLTYEDDDDGNSGLQPVWRTARRTVMHRVPRPHPSAFDADDTDDTDFARYSDIEDRSKSNVDVCNNKGRPVKKSYARSQCPLSDRKNSKKQSKKSCTSNQKTRTLSSIATEKRHTNPVSEARGNQPAKPEGATPSTCVPVKLVFSRINKALEKMSPSQEKEQL